jgi:ATP-binding cassette subfamily C protein
LILTSPFKVFNESALGKSFYVLPPENRIKIFFATILQVFLNIFDLIGVGAIGFLGALAVSGIQSQVPGNRVSQMLNFLRIDNFTFQNQVAILGISASIILVIRTCLSIIITRRIFFFLSRQGALLTSNLFSRLLAQNLLQIQLRTTQETLYSLTLGVTAVTLGVLGSTVALIADGSLLIILIAAMFFVDPTIAISCIVFFGGMGVILFFNMSVQARNLGDLNSKLSVKSNEKIIEILESFRESWVRNTRQNYVGEIKKSRFEIADITAKIQFMPNISKYIIESGMVIGAVVISGILFEIQDAQHAVAALSVFLAAGARIAPASLRFQQNLIQVKNSIGSASPTLFLIESLVNTPPLDSAISRIDPNHLNFDPTVEMKNVNFSYPSSTEKALSEINLFLGKGQSLAVVWSFRCRENLTR